MDDLPDKARTMARLGRLPNIVADALVKATSEACAYFVGKPFNLNLFNHQTRYAAQVVFATEQLEASEDEDFGFESHNIPNIGLQLYCDGLLVKILKFAPNKAIPTPASAARLQFLKQATSFVIDRRTNTLLPVDTNLLFLWDSPSREKAELANDLLLLCPAGVSKDVGVLWAWREPIALPTLSVTERVVFSTTDERTDRADLDIEPATNVASDNDLRIVDPNAPSVNEAKDDLGRDTN